jgi:hypothetical protein
MSAFPPPSPPSQQQGLSKNAKFGFFGCLGLIVLFFGCAVLIGIISKLGPNSNRSTSTQPSPSPTTQSATMSTPIPTPEPDATPKKSYEYMLATLDNGYVDEDDIVVNRYRYLLDSLEKKTTNTRQQIADMTVNVQQRAREHYGKELKLIDILEGSNKVIPDGRKMDYAEVSAMVMAMLAQ